jgi:hypothetical protein
MPHLIVTLNCPSERVLPLEQKRKHPPLERIVNWDLGRPTQVWWSPSGSADLEPRYIYPPI